jgi:uncharacterized protein
MIYEFRWNAWNVEHIAEHGISQEEAEAVVRGARPPYPRETGGGKVVVRGWLASAGFLQVAFVIDPDESLYVIHARPLSESEKRSFRRSTK